MQNFIQIGGINELL